MSKQYYYTVNTLPHLSFGKPPSIRKEEFFRLTKKELTAIDFTILQSADVCPPGNGASLPALTKWYAWETTLRNELVRKRASKRGLDAKEFTRGKEHDDTCSRLVDEVCRVESPLGAQRMLDQARWRFLEGLEFNHYFDIELLVIYFLKLQLLEKQDRYDRVKGRETLDVVVSQVEDLWNRKKATELTHEN